MGDDANLIKAHQASTYVQITHYNQNELTRTQPREIGVRLTPFPIIQLKPDSATFPASGIARCTICGSFINKYVEITKEKDWICNICGKCNTFKGSPDFSSPEYKNEVYEVYCHKQYAVRESFVPTDIIVISLSLVLEKPEILDAISYSYSTIYRPKQIGIVFLHGAISVLKFRKSLSLQTFPDSIPEMKKSQILASSAGFRAGLMLAKSKILALKITEQSNSTEKGILFGLSAAKSFGSSLRIILSEYDLHSCANVDHFRDDTLESLLYGAQSSLIVITNNDIQYYNPLFYLPLISGGILRFFKYDKIENDVGHLFQIFFNSYLYHDTHIIVKASNATPIMDYSGNGMLKSAYGISIPKIEVSDSFYFTLNSKEMTTPYIQFAIFYTTDVDNRKVRIITVPIYSIPLNLDTMTWYIASTVSHTFLIENEEAAKSRLRRFNKEFSKYDERIFEKANQLFADITMDHKIERAQIYRTGPKRNQVICHEDIAPENETQFSEV